MKPVLKKFLQSLRTIFWAFLGIRKKADLEFDFTHMKFIHIVLAAVVVFILMIALLIIIVKVVITQIA